MTLFYIDTSAALKLLVRESHSLEFARFFDDHAAATWVSSALLRIELMRTVARLMPRAAPSARELLDAFDYIGIDEGVIDAAINELDPALRSLDAIHLATARLLGSDLEGIATYDDRMARAAHGSSMVVVSPRDDPPVAH